MVSKRIVAAAVAGAISSALAARGWGAQKPAGLAGLFAARSANQATEAPEGEESWVEDIDLDDIAESFIGSLGAGVVLLGVVACMRMRGRRRRHGWLRMPAA